MQRKNNLISILSLASLGFCIIAAALAGGWLMSLFMKNRDTIFPPPNTLVPTGNINITSEGHDIYSRGEWKNPQRTNRVVLYETSAGLDGTGLDIYAFDAKRTPPRVFLGSGDPYRLLQLGWSRDGALALVRDEEFSKSWNAAYDFSRHERLDDVQKIAARLRAHGGIGTRRDAAGLDTSTRITYREKWAVDKEMQKQMNAENPPP